LGRGVDVGQIERAADACEDFYEFANGAWRSQNPIPAGRPRWSPRALAHAANEGKLHDLLEELAARTDWPKASSEQLLADYYASCMDGDAIESADLKPVSALLGEIDEAKTLADLATSVRHLHELGLAAPFAVTFAFEYENPTNFLVNVGPGALGMSDRERYLQEGSSAEELRAKYRVHIATLFRLSGMRDREAEQAAAAIASMEKRLAVASMDAKTAAEPRETAHKNSYAQLHSMMPSFPWDTYFDEARLPHAALNVTDPKFVQALETELRGTSLAVWKNYLRFQLLDGASPWLSRRFAEEHFAFNERALTGASTMKARPLLCAESTEASLGEPLGKEYANRYFPAESKAKAEAVAASLREALAGAVRNASWMSEGTRARALRKVDAMNIEIGTPSRWVDYSPVNIRRDQFWANLAQARTFLVENGRRATLAPTDRHSWLLSPASADAYIDIQLNEIVLPAGFLQPPFFDVTFSDAVLYGSFGAGLMHDLTHSIDKTGADFDEAGHPVKWWTKQDEAAFDERARCVVDEVESFAIEPGVHHRGKLVEAEAVADLAGVRLAYGALESRRSQRPAPLVDGFSTEQQFFLAWGQFRGDAMRPEAARELVKSDPHPLPKFRVIGPLSDLPAFQEAFACKDAAAMVRPESKRCSVW
jgi:endothelin-converting enzyme/putative endopeptidase